MKQTVLIADDDAGIRDMIGDFLREQGFATVEAANGIEALYHIRWDRPAAVVLDLLMPRLGGIDALAQIRRFDPAMPVVVVTGAHDAELIRQARSLGPAAVLVKPFELSELLTAIQSRPRVAAPTGSDSERPTSTAAAADGKVLVVDDDPEVCDLLKEFLIQKGYRTRSVGDGAAALQSVFNEQPDVILLDINLPRLGGLEALAAIRAIAPEAKVIMISGQAAVDHAERVLGYGAFDFIAKPFDLDYLAQSVDSALQAKSLTFRPPA